ncbi:hypothetical protein AOLI_G00039940 [Acnodon oligacanthus]
MRCGSLGGPQTPSLIRLVYLSHHGDHGAGESSRAERERCGAHVLAFETSHISRDGPSSRETGGQSGPD